VFRFIISAAVLTVFLATPNMARAGGGCPSGYTPQGGVCKPYQGPYVPPGYGYGNPYRYGYGYQKPCPEGFTVQGGVCKPYRGPYVPNYYYR
jgi:hypothetical protein